MIARRTFITTFAAVVAASSVAACATRANSVDGTVSYRERLILPFGRIDADIAAFDHLDHLSRF